MRPLALSHLGPKGVPQIPGHSRGRCWVRTESRATRGGFSLVELLIVIGILAVMAAVAVPRFGRAAERYRLDLAADQLARDLSMVRESARSRGNGMSLLVDPEKLRYIVPSWADPRGDAARYTVRLDEEPYRVEHWEIKGSLGFSITFDEFGGSNTGGEITLMSGGQSRTVVIEIGTGAIRRR